LVNSREQLDSFNYRLQQLDCENFSTIRAYCISGKHVPGFP